MFRKASRWLSVMLLTFLVGSLWIWVSRVPVSAERAELMQALPRAGFPAPEMTLPELNGGLVSLDTFRGQPILVNFWATWCGPCRAEMPDLEAVAATYQDQGLVVLLINQGDTPEQVNAYLQEVGITQRVLLDAQGAAATAYRVRALPSTFWIDRDGVIQDVTIGGPMTRPYIESRLARLMGPP